MSDNKPTRYYSEKQEKHIAETFDGHRSKNSGATMFDKSDVSLDEFLIECKTKTTDSESITIKKEWLDKLSEEALFMGKPKEALAFSFGPSSPNYYIIPEWLFAELYHR